MKNSLLIRPFLILRLPPKPGDSYVWVLDQCFSGWIIEGLSFLLSIKKLNLWGICPLFTILVDCAFIKSWQRPCLGRRAVNPEPISFLDSDSDYVSSRPGLEVFGTRYYRHARHPSPEGFAEVCPCSPCVLSI